MFVLLSYVLNLYFCKIYHCCTECGICRLHFSNLAWTGSRWFSIWQQEAREQVDETITDRSSHNKRRALPGSSSSRSTTTRLSLASFQVQREELPTKGDLNTHITTTTKAIIRHGTTPLRGRLWSLKAR